MRKSLLIFLLLPFAASAQLSTNQKTQVTSMIATAVSKLQVEIKWLRAGKTADSLLIIGLNNTIANNRSNDILNMQTQNKNISLVLSEQDSLRAMIPPIFKTNIGAGLVLSKDTTLSIDPILLNKLSKLP